MCAYKIHNVVTDNLFKKSQCPFLIGVDEAGRGPLAGPLAVGALFVRDKSILRRFAGVKDSKKLSEKKREEWFLKIELAEKKGLLSFEVALLSASEIDEKGMSACLKKGVRRALRRFAREQEYTRVLLDGTLHAPKEFIHQTALIKGDERERIIAMASIVAKVTRDHLMVKLAHEYPQYGFEQHKGYGTKVHYKALTRFGASPIHRLTFLRLECGS